MIFSRLIAFPFLVLLGLGLYFIYSQDQEAWNVAILLAVVGLVIIYVFSHQLNLWWWRRYPPRFEAPLRKFVLQSFPVLQTFDESQWEEFETRLSIYLKTCEFMGMELKSFPEDVKAAILAPGVYLSMIHDDPSLYEPYQRVVIYQHPFLSPLEPDQVHTVEVNREDGVIIFSLPQLMHGILNPSRTLHLALYAYATLLELPDSISEVEIDPMYPKIIGLEEVSQSGVFFHDSILLSEKSQRTTSK